MNVNIFKNNCSLIIQVIDKYPHTAFRVNCEVRRKYHTMKGKNAKLNGSCKIASRLNKKFWNVNAKI